MKHQYTTEQQAFRQEIIQFLKEELPADWQNRADGPIFRGGQAGDGDDGFERQFTKKIADKGWLTMAWPVENGGKGATYLEQFIFDETMATYAAPNIGAGAVNMLAPPLSLFGIRGTKGKVLAWDRRCDGPLGVWLLRAQRGFGSR